MAAKEAEYPIDIGTILDSALHKAMPYIGSYIGNKYCI
jgi:hypothetical protein